MSLNLESIQEMWEKDAKIDRDNLHEESLNIPSLHAKYFELYNTIFLLRKKAEQQRKNIRHERYEYFSGKSDPDVYIENPFPKKIRDKDTMQKYLDADDKLSNSSLDEPSPRIKSLTLHSDSRYFIAWIKSENPFHGSKAPAAIMIGQSRLRNQGSSFGKSIFSLELSATIIL